MKKAILSPDIKTQFLPLQSIEGGERISDAELLRDEQPSGSLGSTEKGDLLTGENTTPEEQIEDTLTGSTKNAATSSEIAPVIFQTRVAVSYIEIEETFNSGYFTADSNGLVEIDYLYDGGGYQGELAIFSLENIEEDTYNDPNKFSLEAARRALSNSAEGYIVISDRNEGALLESKENKGQYQGLKEFQFNPGEKFAVMLVPNGTVQEIFDNPQKGGSKKPLFSLSTTEKNDNFSPGQIAEYEKGIYAMEDQRVDGNTDKDYNDIIFKINGASGETSSLSTAINPNKDWRETDLEKELQNYLSSAKGFDFNSGYFTVGETGEIDLDYIYDGGDYKGELAIFSLEGIDELNITNRSDLIKEASRRALTNSEEGYVVISDPTEGAYLKSRENKGKYLGPKTFKMNPGDKFGFMLVPNGKVREAFNNPDIKEPRKNNLLIQN